jgi:hypothetical protein
MQNAAARREAEAAAGDLAAQLEKNNISRQALQGIYLKTRRSYNESTILLFSLYHHSFQHVLACFHDTSLSLDKGDAECRSSP